MPLKILNDLTVFSHDSLTISGLTPLRRPFGCPHPEQLDLAAMGYGQLDWRPLAAP